MTLNPDDPMLENMPEGVSEDLPTSGGVEVVDPSEVQTPPTEPTTAAPSETELPATDPPPPAAATTDLSSQIQALVALQTQQLQNQQVQAQQEALRQQQAQQPRPLLEQAEWVERYQQAQQQAGYDPNAAATVARMNAELVQEQVNFQMQQVRQQLSVQAGAGRVLDGAADRYAAQSGGLVSVDDYRQMARQVFNNDDTLMAQALQNPANAEYVLDLAIGRKVREGRAAPPARPAPPAPVQPASREPTTAKPGQGGQWGDKGWANGVIGDAFMNPDKYTRKAK